MNSRVIGLSLVFVAFAALTAVAFEEFGLPGFLAALNANSVIHQVFTDLVIALSIATWFIRRDARELGLPWLPYLGVTLLLGSFGPLAYLIHRELASRPRALRAEATR
jgi:hypothetical protein